MTMTLKAVVVIVLLALPLRAATQEVDRRPTPVFLERSHIFTRAPIDDLLFEGQIAPHLYLTRADVWGEGDVFDRPVWSWTASFTPMIRLRMLTTNSFPVRTPSYMPRPLLDWQIFRASATDTSAALREFAEVPVRLWGLTVTPWAHHSNGQEGCLFAYQTRDPDNGDCVGDPPSDGVPEVNRVDGSFSTNFIRLGIGYSYFGVPQAIGDRLERIHGCTFQAGVEVHPVGYLPGGVDRLQAEYYPQVQATLGAEWARSWLAGTWTVGGEARWLDHTAPDVGTWAHSTEISYTPRGLPGWGVFARYYNGMDYYNLGFMEEAKYLHFGFVWDLGSSVQFRFPSSSDPGGRPSPRYEQNALLDRVLPAPLDWVCGLLP